jgi:hypothetical protein
VERENAENLRLSLPSFPITASSVCSPVFPLVVPRPPERAGAAAVALRVDTASRRDQDRFTLRCLAP